MVHSRGSASCRNFLHEGHMTTVASQYDPLPLSPKLIRNAIDVEMSVGPEAFSNAPSIGLDITH